jgi:hypothetical protein
MSITSVDIAQKTLFGDDERVADAATIAQSAVGDLQFVARASGKKLSKKELRVRAEWLALSRYPGALVIMSRFVNPPGYSSDTVAAMTIDPAIDAPCFDTISREIRRVVNKK